MKAGAHAATEPAALVVFGKDEAGKPHASAFTAADAELATKAATLMGMQLLQVVTNEQHALAAKLPTGRVFASGRAFVPFVRAGLYEALVAALSASLAGAPADSESGCTGSPEAAATASAGHGGEPAAAPGETPPSPPARPPIAVGSVVLAPEASGFGWWESVVVKHKGKLLTLRWRDYPDDPQFTRRPEQLALFNTPDGLPLG
jgi:hypothetical protein